MRPFARPVPRTFALVLSLGFAGACQDAQAPAPITAEADSDLTAASLGSMADAARLAGDTAGASAFAEAQRAVAGVPVPGLLRVTQDGVAEEWRAVAYRTRVPAFCPLVMGPTTPLVCRLGGGPSLVAWSTARPERLLLLSAPEGNSAVPGPTGPTPPTPATVLRGTYVDRSVTFTPLPPNLPGIPPLPQQSPVAAVWGLTAGTASQQTTDGSVPCDASVRTPPGLFGRCVNARSVVRFGVTATLFAGGTTTGARSRQLAAAETTLPAVVWQVDSLRTPPLPVPGPTPAPPSPVPSVLASRLEVVSVSADAVVVRLTVRNVSAAPVVLGYRDAQRVEFEALAPATRTVGWRWSTGAGFAAVAGADTLAAGAERRTEATWRTPTRGAWVLRGFTVNTMGPRAESVAPVVVP